MDDNARDPRGLAVRVLRGRPGPAELAALVAVLAAARRCA
ncbi:acyl-CoA carboxylase epsilon subunit, partial [Marinitenerispora sediminis]